jgi:hypothetical protein
MPVPLRPPPEPPASTGTRAGWVGEPLAGPVDGLVLGVALALAPALAPGATALRCTAPRSHAEVSRAAARWSTDSQFAPALSTGLFAAGIMVKVGPPLDAGAASRGFAEVTLATHLVERSADEDSHCTT